MVDGGNVDKGKFENDLITILWVCRTSKLSAIAPPRHVFNTVARAGPSRNAFTIF